MKPATLTGAGAGPDPGFSLSESEAFVFGFGERDGMEVQGVLCEYYAERGVGFIRDGNDQEWVFHIHDVRRGPLADTAFDVIPGRPRDSRINGLPVAFENGGRSPYGNFPKAVRVCILR